MKVFLGWAALSMPTVAVGDLPSTQPEEGTIEQPEAKVDPCAPKPDVEGDVVSDDVACAFRRHVDGVTPKRVQPDEVLPKRRTVRTKRKKRQQR